MTSKTLKRVVIVQLVILSLSVLAEPILLGTLKVSYMLVPKDVQATAATKSLADIQVRAHNNQIPSDSIEITNKIIDILLPYVQ